ncbi:hypothetical protein NX059_004235 [Plenodomus lindquistii]|nr:hypothetical protein NX059_004235 [Plenodomus lindquistii]
MQRQYNKTQKEASNLVFNHREGRHVRECERLALFEYTALPARHIRLITPATTDKPDGRSWTFQDVSLDAPDLKFEALSYVWGAQDVTHPIRCNGSVLRVHDNLHSALPYLARRGDRRPVLPIWIDAICINQQDDQEKKEQIKMMARIYGQAVKVWVWLGLAEHQELVPDAIKLFPRIAEANKYVGKLYEDSDSTPDDVLDIFDPRKVHDTVWSTLLHFLENEWFSRVWTVQEAVLPQELECLCGDLQIAWKSYQDLLFCRFSILETISRRFSHFDHSRKLVFTFRWGVQKPLSPEGDDVAQLLCYASLLLHPHLACSNPKDRILGLLALAGNFSSSNPQLAMLGDLDSVFELYTHFSIYILTNTDMVNDFYWKWVAMAFMNRAKRNESLPSWVPDFHQQTGYDRIGRVFVKSYSPSTRQYSQPRPGKRLDQLIFRGKIFDFVASIFSGPPQDQETDKAAVEWEMRLAKVVLTSAIDGRLIERARQRDDSLNMYGWYWSTLCATDFSYSDRERKIREGCKLTDQYRSIQQDKPRAFWGYCGDSHGPSDEVSLSKDEEDVCVNMKKIIRFAARELQGNELFKTQDGRFGFATAGFLPGHRFCIFNGAPVVYVLRLASDASAPEGETWQLIAEAYVHGMMNGEIDQTDVEERDIVLV